MREILSSFKAGRALIVLLISIIVTESYSYKLIRILLSAFKNNNLPSSSTPSWPNTRQWPQNVHSGFLACDKSLSNCENVFVCKVQQAQINCWINCQSKSYIASNIIQSWYTYHTIAPDNYDFALLTKALTLASSLWNNGYLNYTIWLVCWIQSLELDFINRHNLASTELLKLIGTPENVTKNMLINYFEL